MNATLSLVPTPSALATSTGSCTLPSSANNPPNDPTPDSTPGVYGRRGERLDPTHGLVAGVDVHAGLLVVDSAHQNSKLSISARPLGDGPSRPAPTSTRCRIST